MKKLVVWVVVLVVLGGGGYFAYQKYGKTEVKPTVTEGTVTRGNVIETVAATGTLSAVKTVDIGTQVTGTVKKLYADFNDLVKAGQLLAELDPTLLQTQVQMQEANLKRAEVDIAQRKITMENDQKKLERARELFAKNLITREALDAAELQVKIDQSSLDSSEASKTQTIANLEQAKTNVGYTKIYAPIDGVILVRNTDEGRTVNASTSSPTLYTMATDLTSLLLTASIDEAEVSKVRPGQTVNFRVDAQAGQTFYGTVKQVRLNAKNQSNVITYETVIDVRNPDLRLKPGMTATLNVEVHRADNVLRIPSAALRFRPTTEMFELIKQPVPPEAQQGAGRNGGQGGRTGGRNGGDAGGNAAAPGGNAAPAAGAGAPAAGTTPQAGQTRGGGNGQATDGRTGGNGGGRGGMNLTPEQQKQLDAIRNNQSLTQEQRRAEMAKIFGNNSPFGGGRGNGGGRNGRNGQQGSGQAMTDRGATTIDALLPPVAIREMRNQRVWLWVDGQLKPVNGLTTSVSDGQFTALVSGDLKEGDKVVTNFVIPGAKTTGNTQQQGNPFQPQGGGRGGFGRGGF
jgi:HlyD family secretion protein